MVKIVIDKVETVKAALEILEAHYKGLEDGWVKKGKPMMEIDNLFDADEALAWVRELHQLLTTGVRSYRSPFEYEKLEEVNSYLSKL